MLWACDLRTLAPTLLRQVNVLPGPCLTCCYFFCSFLLSRPVPCHDPHPRKVSSDVPGPMVLVVHSWGGHNTVKCQSPRIGLCSGHTTLSALGAPSSQVPYTWIHFKQLWGPRGAMTGACSALLLHSALHVCNLLTSCCLLKCHPHNIG
jgi:hypothetical protein